MKVRTLSSALFVSLSAVAWALPAGAEEPKSTKSKPVEAAAAPAAEPAAAPASAPASTTPAPRAREKGFYLRMAAGPGSTWAGAGQTAAQPDLNLQGFTGNVMVNPGYMVLPGLVIHGDVYAAMSFARKVTTDDSSPEYVAEGAGLLMYTLGGGVSYHAMPVDLYVSAGAGLTYALATQWTEVTDENGLSTVTSEGRTTDPGFGAHGSVGKLFALGEKWALGPSLNYNYQSFGRRDEAALSVQNAHTVWLGASVTFQAQE